MAEDTDYGAANSIADVGRGIYKKANDVMDTIRKVLPGGSKPAPTPDSTIPQMNKKLNDQSVSDANKSFIPTQTMAQKKTSAPVKSSVKVVVKSSAARKR